MKVHKNLKELLLDYENEKDHMYNRPVGIDQDDEMFINHYVSNNSLALGKPEPLRKNKQFDNACRTCGKPVISLYNTNLYCDEECYQKACTQA